MLDWVWEKKKSNFVLTNELVLQRKGGKGYFSWSKKKSDDVKKELKTFKEIACAREGIVAEILHCA